MKKRICLLTLGVVLVHLITGSAVVSETSDASAESPDMLSSTVEKDDSVSNKKAVSEDTALSIEPVGEPDSSGAGSVDSTAPRGMLHVESNPSGTQVHIDGISKGKTPVTIPDLSAGAHELVLQKSGYYQKKATIQIVGGDTGNVNLILKKPAVLVVESTPLGADVTINNRSGHKTPAQFKRLKPGSYELELSLAGYQTIKKSVTLLSGASDTLRIALPPLEKGARSETAQPDGEKEEIRHPIFHKIALGTFIASALILLLLELLENNE